MVNMKSPKFNKILAQLECINSIEKVRKDVEPLYISDFIHHVFENKEEYGLGGTTLNAEWFSEFSEVNKESATKMISNILESKGHRVESNAILEGIDLYNKGFEYDE